MFFSNLHLIPLLDLNSPIDFSNLGQAEKLITSDQQKFVSKPKTSSIFLKILKEWNQISTLSQYVGEKTIIVTAS